MAQLEGLQYCRQLPNASLSPFVQFYWGLRNNSPDSRPVIILPDGYFDILFTSVNNQPFAASLIGLATAPASYTVKPNAITFAISFKLPAVESLLPTNISGLLNGGKKLPGNFWNLEWDKIDNLDGFVAAVSQLLLSKLPAIEDPRKQLLFEKLYAEGGNSTVGALAAFSGWNAREINRYFRQYFGLPFKAYCNILRFRAAFGQLHKGQLSPSLDYHDQAHFIKEVQRFAGTSPKHLAINKDDRFIQFSTL